MIIGLQGYAGSGKDTVASLLKGEGFLQLAFADALRLIMEATDPIVGVEVNNLTVRYNEAVERFGYDEAKRLYPEIRRLLQRLGTEGIRSVIGEDVWVDIMRKRISPNVSYVISDVRFDNEAAFVKEHGVLVTVKRHGTSAPNAHSSELHGFPWGEDYVIDNNATIEALNRNVKRLVDDLTSRMEVSDY